MIGRFAREDVRAGWIDAGRVARPSWRGARCGDWDYRLGYVARMLVR